MGNRFYVPGQERARRVQELFCKIAPRYDLINDLQSFGLHRLWKRKLTALAEVGPGQTGLDLCCGTGDVALALARKATLVLGLDFSLPMLELAHRRRGGQSGLAFLQGDALRIPAKDESFDAVTISYGLRNLADLEAGLREMHRVTKPGGRLLVLDFGKPPNPVWRWFYFAYLRLGVPLFGKVFCGDKDTYAYILESLRHYPAQEGVAAAMRDMACEEVRVFNLLGGMMSINYGRKGGSA